MQKSRIVLYSKKRLLLKSDRSNPGRGCNFGIEEADVRKGSLDSMGLHYEHSA